MVLPSTCRAYRDFLELSGLNDQIHAALDALDVDDVNALAKKITVCLGSRRKTTGNRYTSAYKVADHLAEGCVLAPHMLHIMDAELIEGNYVLYQGDLSTNCVGKSSGRWTQIGRAHV